MGDLFFRIYRNIKNNRIASVSVLLLILGALVFSATNVQFKDDITALIPSNPETRRIQKVLKSIAFTDKIIVNIERPQETSIDEFTQSASDFLDSLQKKYPEYIKSIQGKVDDAQVLNTFDLVYNHLPLFLDEEDYAAIDRKLRSDSIQSQMEQNYRTLVSPSGIIAKKSILKDPLGLSFIALKKLQKLGVAEDFKLKNGFLLNKEETNILLFITPVNPSSATVENQPLAAGLYNLKEQLYAKYGNNIHVSFFGAALVAVANAQQVKNDIIFTVSIAMAILLILLMLFYKRVTLPLILFTPTLFGALLAISFLALTREYISAVSLGIGAILLGVTLDYALHILTHIRKGEELQLLYREVAPSILMSSLTTASAFLCLLFLESQALQDLGIFASISVVGSAIFSLLFIPQVYVFEGHKERKTTVLEKVAAFEFQKSKWAIGILTLGFILSIFYYNRVTFNQDISKLNYESEVLIEARKKLESLTDLESKSVYLSTYGEQQENVLQRNDAIFENLKALKRNGTLINFTSVSSLIKSERTQNKKIERWQQFWTNPKMDSLQIEINENAENLGFKTSTFQSFYDWLQTDFDPMELSEFKDIPALSVDDYIVKDSTGTTVTSLIKLNDDKYDQLKPHFSEEENTLLINRKEVNESFLGTLKRDFNRLLWLSFVTVVLILALFYRSLSLTLVTAVPIFLTWFLTVGVMGVLGIEFNIFNIIICSFIFGLGVDYSIFVTNGLLLEHQTGIKSLPTHKTSIILSVITTIASVGVMIFAKHPALYAISRVSLIGIFSAAFVAFTIQPSLFRLFIGNRNKRPISLRYFIHSVLSFLYFGLGGIFFSIYAWIVTLFNPNQAKKQNLGFHKAVSKLMKSVLYTNPFVKKQVLNPSKETFEKPAMLIANHTSFLDILCIGMLHPKIIFLVNDWVYNSPIFGKAAKLAGAYPVSGGVENGEAYLQQKLEQGFSIIAFPEGTRSTSNKIKRFHKGAFYLAEKFQLDLIPILIHGNSEVLPKGSFVIRDGSITVKIMPRIPFGDKRFGENYSQQAKKIGAQFREDFKEFRTEIEVEGYWTKTLLENFRFKNDHIYKKVKSDLKANSKAYRQLLEQIPPKAGIIHLTKDEGQLDLLLCFDSMDRKLHTYLEDNDSAIGLEQNFLLQKYAKITCYTSMYDALSNTADILLINLESFSFSSIETKNFETIILIKSGRFLDYKEVLSSDFLVTGQNDKFIVLNKKPSN
ncbi:MMPL family transporter [Maribacter sp. PR1]|uniref:1-acyl-sn-glycerol-3-phosphate acyltransferase n=1 Tax=Maribacter cobaltidurans TaxID=1178778 RepID=A0ABU7IQ06_9FLAO|nr:MULTISPECIES: 1-acyl-sn-glycerol-3-phosphate acyltransferase [Maribacter]MDC6387648.1 MMPL family transporter [Maribacter sp. PR1]MEE1975036.1 1-acyl-sn-glycerol-3-phosphate acyltransferase [Maribacter cobaltidurans]